MLLLDEGEAIAGQLIDLEETVPRLWSLGVLNGDAALWKKRVLPASVIFASEYLAQASHKTTSLGDSRSFLSDGVLQHTMKWGLELVKNSDRGYLLNLWRSTSGLQGFLRSDPFLCITQGDLYLVAFTTGEADARNQLNRTLEQASNLGVTRFRLYSFTAKIAENLQIGSDGTTVMLDPAAELFSDLSLNQPGKGA